MRHSFAMNGVLIEVDIRNTPCGPDIQDTSIGGYSVTELFDGTELQVVITDYVEANYQSWLAEQEQEEHETAAERKYEECRDRALLKEAA